MDKIALGVDIGGRGIKVGIVNQLGVVLKTQVEKTTTPGNLISFLKEFSKSLSELVGIGVGSPGPLDLKSGKILDTPNLESFKFTPIVKLLKDEFNLPVFLERDTNVALIGEAWKGAAQNKKNVIMLTLGTGIGGAILINSALYTGEHGMGCEIGHMVINIDGNICGCGRRGCLESEIGEKGIVEKFGLNPRQLIDQVQSGVDKAIESSRELGQILGIGLGSLVNIFDPEIIILGGGQIKLGEVYMKEAIYEMKARTLVSNHPVKVEVSQLGDDAGIIGAAKMVFDG